VQLRFELVAMAMVLAAAMIGWSPALAAEENDRAWAGGVGVGGNLALTGPVDSGLSAMAALYPGAWAGRLGARLEARTASDDDPFERGMFLAGLAYETAAARPRLSLALHGDAGALAPDPRAVIGGGAELQLWLVGPLALALESSAHLVLDGLDSELILAGGLGLRIAR
jgi:hypothetical protein